MGWKYVVLEIDRGGVRIDFPIIFPDKFIHIEVATVVKLCAPLDGNNPRVVSAGSIDHIRPLSVGGESTTLRMKSRTGDGKMIEMYSYMHGIKT
jgi:hypothetical protein